VRGIVGALVPVVAVLAGPLPGCSSPGKLAGAGDTCLLTTDCVDGLVCVPATAGRRACSGDLSSIDLTEDASNPAAYDAGSAALDAVNPVLEQDANAEAAIAEAAATD